MRHPQRLLLLRSLIRVVHVVLVLPLLHLLRLLMLLGPKKTLPLTATPLDACKARCQHVAAALLVPLRPHSGIHALIHAMMDLVLGLRAALLGHPAIRMTLGAQMRASAARHYILGVVSSHRGILRLASLMMASSCCLEITIGVHLH